MTEPTEDIPYEVGDHATPDRDSQAEDVDQPNKSVLLDLQKYIDEAIDTHNSYDGITLDKTHPLTAVQQIAVAKILVGHLRDLKQIIDKKVEELA